MVLQTRTVPSLIIFDSLLIFWEMFLEILHFDKMDALNLNLLPRMLLSVAWRLVLWRDLFVGGEWGKSIPCSSLRRTRRMNIIQNVFQEKVLVLLCKERMKSYTTGTCSFPQHLVMPSLLRDGSTELTLGTEKQVGDGELNLLVEYLFSRYQALGVIPSTVTATTRVRNGLCFKRSPTLW